MNIPMLNLKRQYDYMKKDIDDAISKCLNHQQWIMGPEVYDFEKNCSEFLGIKHCIGCSSGTEAIVLALRAIAISQGKEFFSKDDLIITTPFTFTATGDAILRSGATPVFVDIELNSFNIAPEKIKKYLENDKKKRVCGIVVVHLYGIPCNMDEICKLASEHGVFIIEDVAQAFGGKWKEKKLGTIGNAGAFSFFPSKNLGCFGDGGMVSTSDDKIAEIVRILIKHGGKDKYNVDFLGYNARLDTIQAAVLLARMKFVDEFNNRRKSIAKRYNNFLSEIKEIKTPEIKEGSVFHQYTIRVPEEKRDTLQKFLKEKGISTMVYYPVCLHEMKLFNNRAIFENLSSAERVSRQVISLPIDPLMTEQEQDYVIANIKEFFQKNYGV
ncbi:MAG: DegT/DnrJ/EryC1/StrS family aminotransferase [Candidatus Omnitrophica bacterium]|nr:DegT/DnrJ/EryC1/StrS family aminotransferase [Candidatus Omnitrophota bacterium]